MSLFIFRQPPYPRIATLSPQFVQTLTFDEMDIVQWYAQNFPVTTKLPGQDSKHSDQYGSESDWEHFRRTNSTQIIRLRRNGANIKRWLEGGEWESEVKGKKYKVIITSDPFWKLYCYNYPCYTSMSSAHDVLDRALSPLEVVMYATSKKNIVVTERVPLHLVGDLDGFYLELRGYYTFGPHRNETGKITGVGPHVEDPEVLKHANHIVAKFAELCNIKYTGDTKTMFHY